MAKRLKRLSVDEKKMIAALLRTGADLETAGLYAALPLSLIQREINKDPEFKKEIQRAQEHTEVFFLDRIKKAAEKEQYWRAAAWALERRKPNRYASRGPETMTVDEVREIFRNLIEFVLGEVSVKEDQKRMAAKMKKILEDLSSKNGTLAEESVKESRKKRKVTRGEGGKRLASSSSDFSEDDENSSEKDQD